MVNRSIQSKIMKMRKRGRYAVFSGAQSGYAERIDRGKFQDVKIIHEGTAEEDHIPTGRHVVVAVGKISLSKAVMSTGRGPDAERMQEYYQRIHSYDKSLPDTIGAVSLDHLKSGRRSESGLRLKDFDLSVQYADFVKGVPKELRIRLVDNHTGTLDLYFSGTQFFFVDLDRQKKSIKRSIVYPSKKRAMMALTNKMVRWVEVISPSKPHFDKIGSSKPSVAPPKG